MSEEVIKADLPNFPDDVIDIWLKTHDERGFGWPPKVDNEWRYIIGIGKDLGFLQKLTWQKISIKPTLSLLSPQSQMAIEGLFYVHTLKPSGAERVNKSISYLKEHGTFPRPIVLRETREGYHVWDGSHRLTAFFQLRGELGNNVDEKQRRLVSEEQEAWIARLPSEQ